MPLIIMPSYTNTILDPYSSNVKLSMHMEGNSLVDSTGRHIFALSSSGAALSTAQKVVGTQSLRTNGTENLPVTTPSHDDFDLGSGDWTIELSVNPLSISSVGQIMGTWRTGLPYSWGVISASGGYCGFCFSVSGAYEPANERGTAGVLKLNTWTRLAFVRYGNTVKMYVDGTFVPFTYGGNTVPSGAILFKSNSVFAIGGNNDNQKFAGYIDEVRITKGIARYTAASYEISPDPFPDV